MPYCRGRKTLLLNATLSKQEAQRLVEKLPDGATWDDLMYEIYVRQAIEAGLEDSQAGRTVDVKDVREVRATEMTVRWTQTAIGHLLTIHEHIAQNSPTYAQRMIRITDTRSGLRRFHSRGKRIAPRYDRGQPKEKP